MALKNTFIYLIGFPATGKYTIAKELVRQDSNIKLVDNHLINNPVFSMLNLDGKTKIHSDIWGYIERIWDIVGEVITHHTDEENSFVFTNVLMQDVKEDKIQFQRIKNIAKRKDGKFVPVLFTCSQDELLKRVGNADRKARHKMLDAEGLLAYTKDNTLIDIEHENLIELDTSHTPPNQIAQIILDKINDREN